MNQTKGYQGKVGFGIKELNEIDLDYYCSNQTIDLNDAPLLNNNNNNNSSFKYDFSIRSYTSGCYYLNDDGYWASDRVEVIEDSNLTHTHCSSSHLTQFAGGFVVLPPAIDFNYVFAHSSFLQNPTIYSTIIALATLYVILAIISRYFDTQDQKKIGLTNLANSLDEYKYEVTIFTGNRFNAGTNSNVSILLLIIQIYSVKYEF